ncbi:hypothetical protein SeMB42_g02845 [Synchytrium endobioticum]|uniref:Uncharacterized protein n=1 Tax=Synchytrium endobioticum TaxID=286115 RepID=A0A507DB80_9FUNG|nr:hypothetical protein SeLEV6574_g08366 [Synchytrium endobioticum]TPX40095.1 hypothetical protein SeLEV6574_g06790 [Synchytrium endobioticum]TPX48833.1 hypothetical protein SeMB42_g02845 [Synchytrium endobioticum]
MLSKVVLALFVASSAVSASIGGDHGYKDGQYKNEMLVKEDSYVSDKGPRVYYDKDYDYDTEEKEDLVKVPYKLKGPKYDGHIRFPAEYAKYETRSEGPHVPETKQKRIEGYVMEKPFVCPKYEKMVVVRVPAKCECESVEVMPKIVKAPEYKELPYDVKDYKEDGYGMHGNQY